MLLMSSPRERNKGQWNRWVTGVCDSMIRSPREKALPSHIYMPYLLEPSIVCEAAPLPRHRRLSIALRRLPPASIRHCVATKRCVLHRVVVVLQCHPTRVRGDRESIVRASCAKRVRCVAAREGELSCRRCCLRCTCRGTLIVMLSNTLVSAPSLSGVLVVESAPSTSARRQLAGSENRTTTARSRNSEHSKQDHPRTAREKERVTQGKCYITVSRSV